MPALVFDLGGTHLRSAVAGDGGALTQIQKLRIGSFADGLPAAKVWNGILSSIAEFAEENAGEVECEDPLILSFPGPIDSAGRIIQAPTLIGDSNDIPDIRAELARLTRHPVYLLNDLSAAAWYFSKTTITGRFLVVTVSSGIGAKIFDPSFGPMDDQPFGGEIGHNKVDESPYAPICDCGGRGHLGAIASGRGIERMARAWAAANAESFSQSACAYRYGATPGTLQNEMHLVPALRDGDQWTIDLIRYCTRFLARTLVSTVIAAALESVVLIGGFALEAGEAYIQILREAAAEICDYALLRDSIAGRLKLGCITEEACLAGAAFYAENLVHA
jgi:C7-cyclitol 7-kinase